MLTVCLDAINVDDEVLDLACQLREIDGWQWGSHLVIRDVSCN